MENKIKSPTPLLDAIEDEILQLDAEEALRMPGASTLAAQAEFCIAAVLAKRQSNAPRPASTSRRRRRVPVVVRSTRRAAARELLVASSSARTLAGTDTAEALSDAEIDEVIEKLNEAEKLPKLED